jgi:hypothetical protein
VGAKPGVSVNQEPIGLRLVQPLAGRRRQASGRPSEAGQWPYGWVRPG